MSKFIDEIKKVKGPRKPSVTGAYKIRDLYYELKNTKKLPKISLETFRLLIRTMGKNIGQLVLEGHVVSLPMLMGKLCIIQSKNTVKFVNGKVKHNYYINWNSTIRLWEEDEEARKNKTLVYYIEDKKLGARYLRVPAKFYNKHFFTFRLTSAIKRNIYKYAEENNIMYHV